MNEIAQGHCSEKIYVGIDVHLRSYAVSVVGKEGSICKWTMPAEPERLVTKLKKEYPGKEISSVYEAGFSGFVLHRVLWEAGISNIVVHAASVAVNSGDRVKTDRRDAEKLARHLAAGLLKGIRIPTPEEELRRQLTRTREQFVRARTRVMVQIRRRLVHFGYLKNYQGILRQVDIRKFLEQGPDDELRFCVASQLRLWEQIEAEMRVLKKRLQEQAAACPLETYYRSVPGIGPVTARILANELGDMSQFANEKALFRFVGLTPSEYSSGEHVRRGHISRQGNPVLRKILVEAAWVAIRKDQSLRTFYSKLMVRAGSRRAIVAVARKLAGRTRATIRKRKEYQDAPTQVVAQAA